MSARRGLLIVLILIALLIAGAVVSARAQGTIACQDGVCVVPQQYLAALVRQAQQAEHYAYLCGWAEEER